MSGAFWALFDAFSHERIVNSGIRNRRETAAIALSITRGDALDSRVFCFVGHLFLWVVFLHQDRRVLSGIAKLLATVTLQIFCPFWTREMASAF